MTEWVNVKLGELGKIVGGSTPSTKNLSYWNGTIPWLTPKDLADFKGRYISTGERNISEDGLKNCSTQLLPKYSVLFTSRAPIGYIAIADNELCTNQGFKSIIPNGKINYLFLYYILKYYKSYLESFASGTTFFELSGSVMKEIKVIVPSDIEVQKKIASILDKIDTKIEINNKINDNLEQQTQAMYTEMFIPTAHCEWQKGHLSDLITIRYGKDHKKLANGPYPVFGSGGLMRNVERPLYNKESVLIPRKGTLNNVMYLNEPFWCVDTMFYTEMRIPNVAKFVYHFIKSQDLLSMNAGSAVPSMTTEILNAIEVNIPSTDALSKFESAVSPLFSQLQENRAQNSKLAELRDVLMPKLMSGELDVSAIDI